MLAPHAIGNNVAAKTYASNRSQQGLHQLQKKQRLASKMPGISEGKLQQISEILDDGPDDAEADSSCKSPISDIKHHTPYGTLGKIINIPLKAGGTLEWLMICPLALLFTMCDICSEFAKLLQRVATYSAGIAHLTLIYYTDETTPGNQVRPDNRRKVQCHYWTFKEFPSWFRTKCDAWSLLGFMGCHEEKEVAAGLSGVVKLVLTALFGRAGANFVDGCRLPDGNGGLFHLKVAFGFFLQDFNAFTAVHCSKGVGALKPCRICRNILQTAWEKITDPYFKHIGEATRADFDCHTRATYFEQVDMLNAAHQADPEKAKDLGKFMGIQHATHGLDSDLYLRTIVDPITATFYDSMHTILASSGMGQYHINYFVRAILEEETLDWTLERLDAWFADIVWEKPQQKLQFDFFASRIAGVGFTDKFFAPPPWSYGAYWRSCNIYIYIYMHILYIHIYMYVYIYSLRRE